MQTAGRARRAVAGSAWPLITLLLLAGAPSLRPADPGRPPTEHEVKAAFLYSFAKSVLGHPILLRQCETVEDAVRAHIVFVSASKQPQLRELLSTLRRYPVLTAGDIDGFAEQGGIVGFTLRDSHVRFDINLRRADEAQLKISSQLLKLATIVAARP